MRLGWLWILGLCLVGLWSCDKEKPSAPLRDNPLDVNNPQTGGDPFALRIESTVDGPRLRWQRVAVSGIEGYKIYRTVDNGSFVSYKEINSSTTTSWVDTSVVLGHRYQYYIVARGRGNTQLSSAKNLTPASWGAPPQVAVAEATVGYVLNRDITL